MNKDQILIEELELSAHLGVPEEERAVAQRLTVTLVLELQRGIALMSDEIGQTVDYAAVGKAVQAEARRRPRKLLETLTEEIASAVLREFAAVEAVEVRVRKYILPDAQAVAVRIWRTR